MSAGGAWKEGGTERNGRTFHLLEDALDGAGAAAAGHGYVELVVVFGHVVGGRGGREG